MNLKIKCDTPKEQVLVLRKFKKLVPECKWSEFMDGSNVLDYIPFVDYFIDAPEVLLFLDGTQITQCPYSPIFGGFIIAYDFLRDDWKVEPEKAEIKAKIKSLEKQLNELKDLLNQ